MATRGEDADLVRPLTAFLADGPRRASDAVRHLRVSQPTFSRLIARHADQFLTVGRSRATEYVARREIEDVGRTLPIYEVGEDGSSRELALLHAARTNAYFVQARGSDVEAGYFRDLPYFLHDLRPSGFLGRLIPRRHPDLRLPPDIGLWTSDQTLLYLSRFGWNLPGALIVGDEAFRLHLLHARAPQDVVTDEERARQYPRFADDLLAAGTPGSSAGGEQPKFLVSRMPAGTAVLVKFSPPVVDATSARLADVLVAEKLCLDVMRAHGQTAAAADVVTADDRVFLEVERFDRLPGGGRRGVLSLFALDAEFVGALGPWDASAAELVRQRRLPAEVVRDVRWRQLFGQLIANTDMHPGNLAFFARGTRVSELAPAYDMGPALYAPTSGHLRTPPFQPPIPSASDAPLWDGVCSAAHEAWTSMADDGRISAAFRAVAARNAAVVAEARGLGRLLPR